jgi:hypothetical protein
VLPPLLTEPPLPLLPPLALLPPAPVMMIMPPEPELLSPPEPLLLSPPLPLLFEPPLPPPWPDWAQAAQSKARLSPVIDRRAFFMILTIPGSGESDLRLPETGRVESRSTANRWGIGGLCTTERALVFAYFAGFSYLADC